MSKHECWMRPVGLNLSMLHRFTKSAGISTKPHVKLLTSVCDALPKNGRPMPCDRSHRQWIMQNAEHIRVRAKTVKAAPKQGRAMAATSPAAPRAAPPFVGDVTGNDFLWSYAWRRLRMQVLEKHGARCQCCGASPQTGAVMNVDHIKPRKLFPELALEIDNCKSCATSATTAKATGAKPIGALMR